MKKLLLVLVLAIAVSGIAFAEFDIMSYPPPIEGGNFLIDAGLGFMAGYDGNIAIPPIYARLEYALPMIPLSVGGSMTFSKYEWRYYYWGYDATYFTLAGRASWHFGFDVPNFDFYAGSSLGYDIVSINNIGGYTGSSLSGFYFGFHAGIHYYFTDNVGITAETGYPYWIKAGIALKF